jgi:hypothetical protein
MEEWGVIRSEHSFERTIDSLHRFGSGIGSAEASVPVLGTYRELPREHCHCVCADVPGRPCPNLQKVPWNEDSADQ